MRPLSCNKILDLTRLDLTVFMMCGTVFWKLELKICEAFFLSLKKQLHAVWQIKDIIHSSKLGQTSPLILPIDQMGVVQAEIAKVSTAVLDPDFSKMQSIVVSDPDDPRLLLVVVNVAALSRQSLELVKLVPIPFFEDGKAYVPNLDYDTIVLDQSTHTYSVLTEQEAYDCLFNRCYISSTEQSVLEKTCGIPQFFDRHTEVCVSDPTISTGVYLKPMLPDGVIFALEKEVHAQLYCKDKDLIGVPKKLHGTGILQLPNGCTLSVIDSKSKVTKIKGQPQYNIITAEDMDIMANSPLTSLQASVNASNKHKAVSYDAFMEKHISSVIRQVEQVDSKIETQHTHIWSLTGLILVVFLLSTTIIFCVYRYSKRFRVKIKALKNSFNEVTQQLLHHEANSPRAPMAKPSPKVPVKSIDVLLHRIQARKKRALQATTSCGELQNHYKESTYMDMEDKSDDESIRYTPVGFKPISELKDSPPRRYPQLTPMMNELCEEECEKLREETEQVIALCSPKTKRSQASRFDV